MNPRRMVRLSRETFGEARVRERFGVDVIGMGVDDAFVTSIGSNDTLAEGTRLLVVGKPDRLDVLRDAVTADGEVSAPEGRLGGIQGYGQAADEALADTRLNRTVVDIEKKDGVDVVGDTSDPDVLTEAGINEVSTLLLTVRDDTTAVFATPIARDLNPDLQIFVRANDEADVQKSYLAGADYVQSLPTVSGRMLASTVLEDETRLTYDTRLSIVRLPAPELNERGDGLYRRGNRSGG